MNQTLADRKLVACNHAAGTSAIPKGALCYVAHGCHYTSRGPENYRLTILARSRSGRWICKVEGIHKLANFRVKTIPPEHPRYHDENLFPAWAPGYDADWQEEYLRELLDRAEAERATRAACKTLLGPASPPGR